MERATASKASRNVQTSKGANILSVDEQLRLFTLQNKLYAWMERNQLKRLYLPTIAEGERGWGSVPLSKMTQLVWQINRPVPPFIKMDIRGALAPAGGFPLKLSVPLNQQWTLYSAYIVYTATATVGTRAVRVDIFDPSGGNQVHSFISDGPTASQTRSYEINQDDTSPATVHRTLNYPVPLLPGSDLRIRENNNIDANDTIDWHIMYQVDDAPFAPAALP